MNLTRFPILNHSVLCLFILIMCNTVLSMPSGLKQKTANEELNFPKKEYQDWLETQRNPDLDDYEKIKSTVTTYFRVVYESWLKRTLFDFGFLFDQSDPEAMGDYAYEKGFHQLWLARWKDYGIQMLSYKAQPEFRNYKKDVNSAEIEASPEAIFVFTDASERNEYHRICISHFELVKQGTQWIITQVKCENPSHYIYPRDADFDNLAREIPGSIEVIETESELMQSMKKHRSPRDLERLKIMQKRLEKPHIMTLRECATRE